MDDIFAAVIALGSVVGLMWEGEALIAIYFILFAIYIKMNTWLK